MLYPRKNEKQLCDELFRNPTAEYRGTPFWAWNCKLEKDELLRQIDVLRDMGFGGFHMHVRSGMATEYLGDEFMELVRACVDKAKDEKMLAYLYDEDRWPSGFAGGLVTCDEQYRMRYLLMTTKPYNIDPIKASLHSNEQNLAARSGCNSIPIARFGVRLDSDGCLESYRTLPEGDDGADGETVWHAYIESPACNPRYNGYTYVNTLDKKSIDRFIDVTYEAYKRSIGDSFGTTVPSIFTDEPQTTFKRTLKFAFGKEDVTLPWTDDIDETYRAAYGIALNEHIPELIWEKKGGEVSRARYLYHDHIAERFAVAFADNIGAWCNENGIYLTGHVMKEPTLESQTQALGEAMRAYRAFGIPGIDMLSDRHEYSTAKQAQSAANQQGCEGMLDELYGVTTWEFDFRGHKLYGDWQAALGVTVRVPHLSWVSMEGEAKRDYPASINYQSPYYVEYSNVEDHFARVNTAMVRGKPHVRIGVIHPIESYWLHWGPAEQTALVRHSLDQKFSNVTEWLLFGSLDFDYICEANLPLLCEKGTNPLQVGQMKYDAIVVPDCETIRRTTLERLREFVADGGKLIFMGSCPRYVDALPSDEIRELYEKSVKVPFTRDALLNSLEDVRDVELRSASSGNLTPEMLYRMRDDGDEKWIFVGRGRDPYNKDLAQCYKILVKVKGQLKPTLYDTMTGEIVKDIPFTFDGKWTVVPAALYQDDSLLLRLTPTDESSVAVKKAPETETRTIDVPKSVKFTLDEPNALVLDMARWSLDGEELNKEEEILRIDTAVRTRLGYTPWGGAAHQPWYLPAAKPVHSVYLRYEFESEIEYMGTRIALENPELCTKLVFNGVSLDGKKTVGYYTDKSIKQIEIPKIIRGTNTFELEMPYGERSALEGIYLLGMFGVRVCGAECTVTALPEKLGFGDITSQGLPFYSGKLTYHVDVTTNGGTLSVNVPRYRASTLRIHADDESRCVAFSPYTANFTLGAGEHKVKIDAYIPRTNGFGPLHNSDEKLNYQSPGAWRSKGDSWSYEYNLTREGVLSRPNICEITPKK